MYTLITDILHINFQVIEEKIEKENWNIGSPADFSGSDSDGGVVPEEIYKDMQEKYAMCKRKVANLENQQQEKTKKLKEELAVLKEELQETKNFNFHLQRQLFSKKSEKLYGSKSGNNFIFLLIM